MSIDQELLSPLHVEENTFFTITISKVPEALTGTGLIEI